MGVFRPPTPIALSSGGAGGGSNIINGSSAIVVNNNTSTGDTNIQITTNDVVAIKIDNSQNVVIGNKNISSRKRLVVSDPLGECVQLINESNNAFANLNVNSTGGLTIETTGSNINLGSNKLYVGSEFLYIGGVRVQSSAEQINYTATTIGEAIPSKALVVDLNRSIRNINSLMAAELTGTIMTGHQPLITSLTSVNINSLKLGGVSVASTASELNYLNGLIIGNADRAKALVVDSNLNIRGINTLQASTLVGIIETANQPNITSLGTLSSLKVNSYIGIGTNNPSRSIDIVSPSPSIGISNETYQAEISIDATGNLKLSSARGIAISPNTNMIFNGTSSITGITNIVASSLSGTIQTEQQPNITSVGSLTNLNVNGDTTLGSLSNSSESQRVVIYEPSGNCVSLIRSGTLSCNLAINTFGDIEISPTRNVRIPSGKSLHMAGPIIGVTDFTASTLTGTLQTASQPNITSVGTLSSLSVTNGISASSLIASTVAGTLQTSSQPNITLVGTLSSLTVTNGISASSLNASTLTGTLQTASQPNITTIGTLSNLSVTNGISATSLIASTLTGTLQTASQPNITTIGTLANLSVINSITTALITSSSIVGTLQTSSQTNITAIGTLSSLDVTNGIIASSLIASTLSGTLQTSSQPNITHIGTLSNLSVTNSITAGSLSAASITGTIQTPYQANITTIGTLQKLTTSGPIGIGVDTPSCAIDINTYSLLVDPIIKLNDGSVNCKFSINSMGLVIDTSGDYITLGSGVNLMFSGGSLLGLEGLTANSFFGTLHTAAQPNITSVGTLTHLDTEYLGVGTSFTNDYRLNILDTGGRIAMVSDGTNSLAITVSNNDYTISTSNNRLSLGPLVSLVLNGGTIIGLNNLTASKIHGVIQTADQPNITSVGDLTSLTVSGNITANHADIESARISGNLIVDGSITISTPLSFDNLSSSTGIFNANIDAISSIDGGTFTVIGGAAFSKSVIIGTSLTVGGSTLTNTTIDKISGATPGTVIPEKFISTDSSYNLTGFNCITSTNLKGTIKTDYQPYITTVGNLVNLNVNGYLGVGNTSPMKQLEINSTTGDCLRLSYDKPTNTSYMDILVDASGNASLTANGGSITIGSKLITRQIMLGNTNNSIMPLEIGSTPFVMTQAYAFNTSANGHGVLPAGGTASYNYSIRACGRILCTQSVDVMSDRRTKKNITELTDEYCSSFIDRTTPVKFNWINGDDHKSFGYIAQELIREGFPDLVNLAKDENIEEEIDEDGFINPAGVKFTVSYQHIIPILAKNQKRLMKENAELKEKLETILKMLEHR